MLVLVGLSVGLALPRPCLACSCVTDDPRAHFRRAGVVFRGRVVEVEEPPRWRLFVSYQTEARLRADAVWKGAPQSEYRVKGGDGGGDCTITFSEGVEYVVYGQGTGDEALETNVCIGTISTDHRSEVAQTLAALGPATPVPAPAHLTTNDGSGARGRLAPLLAGGAALAAAGGIAAWRLRCRSRDAIT